MKCFFSRSNILLLIFWCLTFLFFFSRIYRLFIIIIITVKIKTMAHLHFSFCNCFQSPTFLSVSVSIFLHIHFTVAMKNEIKSIKNNDCFHLTLMKMIIFIIYLHDVTMLLRQVNLIHFYSLHFLWK